MTCFTTWFAAGELTAVEAAAKLWYTEVQWEVMDACLQLHGGAGYMNEYLIARLWRDARVSRIYGGTSCDFRDYASTMNLVNASANSGCQRDRAGRFSMISPAAQAMRFSSIALITSLSGQRI